MQSSQNTWEQGLKMDGVKGTDKQIVHMRSFGTSSGRRRTTIVACYVNNKPSIWTIIRRTTVGNTRMLSQSNL